MLRFEPSQERWWNKPLVDLGGRALPAELAVLAAELGPGERGGWANSSGTKTVVVDLAPKSTDGSKPSRKTKREPLPGFVSDALREIYQKSGLGRGCPDLVIWETAAPRLRLVEVKCPHWDRPSAEQTKFMQAALDLGIPTSIAEWEFTGGLERPPRRTGTGAGRR